MEEDIMILESECYYLEELGYLKENNHFIRFNQALKNLIKDYKEKEEIVKQLDKQMFKFSNEVARDFIPKSKIREIIKELEEEKDKTYTQFLGCNRNDEKLSTKWKMLEGAIQLLQELMEDK